MSHVACFVFGVLIRTTKKINLKNLCSQQPKSPPTFLSTWVAVHVYTAALHTQLSTLSTLKQEYIHWELVLLNLYVKYKKTKNNKKSRISSSRTYSHSSCTKIEHITYICIQAHHSTAQHRQNCVAQAQKQVEESFTVGPTYESVILFFFNFISRYISNNILYHYSAQ